MLTVSAQISGLQSFKLQKAFKVEAGDRIGVLADNSDVIDCTTSNEKSPADLVYNIMPNTDITEGMKLTGFSRLTNKRFKVSYVVLNEVNYRGFLQIKSTKFVSIQHLYSIGRF